MSRQDVLLNWQTGSTFGWGLVGLNLLCQWANDPDIRPLFGAPIEHAADHFPDPLRVLEVGAAIADANRFLDNLDLLRVGNDIVTEAIVVDPVGGSSKPWPFFGIKYVGRCIFEDSEFPGGADFGKYDALLVASRWNAELLGRHTDLPIEIIHEGVDASLFCLGAKSGIVAADKFYIYSGGKIEHRKGQDLILQAFRVFAQRHRDAVLVTSWHSLWPRAAVGYRGRLGTAVEIGPHEWLNIVKWATDNGVPRNQFIDLGMFPNHKLPTILREMDLCLQPSRAEACTSLPVKEAMACGVPVIAAFNTGMRDLLTPENALILTRQGPVAMPGVGTEGWGESDVEEILAHMEWAYQHRAEARALGLAASQWLESNGRTWQVHAQKLKAFLLALL